jgi:hypothetical protein
MSLREPLDAFFADFAVTVTVGSAEVSAIFDREHIEAMGGFGGGIDASVPVALVRSVDVTANAIGVGTTVRLPNQGETWFGNPAWWGGMNFTVRSVRHDGTGMCALVLEVA